MPNPMETMPVDAGAAPKEEPAADQGQTPEAADEQGLPEQFAAQRVAELREQLEGKLGQENVQGARF